MTGTFLAGITIMAQEWILAWPVPASVLIAVLLLLAAWLAQWFVHRYLVGLVARLLKRNRFVWEDALTRRGVLSRLTWAVPLIVLRTGLPHIPIMPAGLGEFIRRMLAAAMVLVVTQALAALLNAFSDVYARSKHATQRPIKSYIQGAILVAYIVAGIIAVAILANLDPVIIFSGLGAASAIIILVFRDTILSLVAGIQLTANDLIRMGDWIEMPQFSADGDVAEIALNYVRVQNWDKTYTVIPAHKFLENSFKNWRGMQESGGRRIKRSIFIDMSTVRFLTREEADRFRRFELLGDYIDSKERELAAWNSEHAESEDPVNSRRLTNIGTFRAYVTAYLRANPNIHDHLTFLVRQLAPTAEGLPLEIYVFTTDVRWAFYEGIQADVFDHLFAILPEFGLEVYQSPSGRDLSGLAGDARRRITESSAEA